VNRPVVGKVAAPFEELAAAGEFQSGEIDDRALARARQESTWGSTE
jgi:hypothetical protein